MASAVTQPIRADNPIPVIQVTAPAELEANARPNPDELELVDDEGAANLPPEDGPEPSCLHPLDGWTPERIRDAVRTDLGSLGSVSIGTPNSGALLNGKRAEASELFQMVDEQHAWGSEETLSYLNAAIRKVHERFPGTAPLSLGHVSSEHGGPLRPHVSHQSGRDLDISFYYKGSSRWYLRASERNLDLPRTWAFVRALVTETDVEMILIDHSVQAWLRRYALAQGEDRAWIDGLFQCKGALRPLIRHAPGHATHIHVRFYNPIAQETARRAQSTLRSEGILPQVVSYLRHKARRGDTLAAIAKKYGASVAAIKKANGLRSSRIGEQREYRIPVRGGAPATTSEPLRFPERRLPPTLAGHEPERTSAAPLEREVSASVANPAQLIDAK